MEFERMDGRPSKNRLKRNAEVRKFNQQRLALIAAAPDLLKAAKQAADMIALFKKRLAELGHGFSDDSEYLLRNAIAKAEKGE